MSRSLIGKKVCILYNFIYTRNTLFYFFLFSFLGCKIVYISFFVFAGMTTRLWNYVSTFSNLSGDGLQQIYTKLKQEGGVGPSHINGSTATFMRRDLDVGKFEAWKRRKRAEADASHNHQRPPPPSNNGNWLPDPHSSGILGPPPSESSSRQFSNGRNYRMQQSRQGFSSGY